MTKFDVVLTPHEGGGWLVHRTSDQPMPDHPFTDPSIGVTFAFRTFNHARNYIATVVKVDKRVRLTKLSDSHYVYKH